MDLCISFVADSANKPSMVGKMMMIWFSFKPVYNNENSHKTCQELVFKIVFNHVTHNQSLDYLVLDSNFIATLTFAWSSINIIRLTFIRSLPVQHISSPQNKKFAISIDFPGFSNKISSNPILESKRILSSQCLI